MDGDVPSSLSIMRNIFHSIIFFESTLMLLTLLKEINVGLLSYINKAINIFNFVKQLVVKCNNAILRQDLSKSVFLGYLSWEMCTT